MAERPLLSYYNRAAEESPVITSSTSATGYPATNAALNDHVHVWRTNSVVAGRWWKVDFGAAKAIDFAFAPRFHNLQTGATVRVQGHASDDWGAPTVNELFAVTAGKAICKYFTGGTLQWWRWTFTDDTNPAGYLELPLLWLGQWQDVIAPISRLQGMMTSGRGATSNNRVRRSSQNGPQLASWRLEYGTTGAAELAVWQAAQAYAAVGPIVYAMDRSDLDDTAVLCDWLGARIGSADPGAGAAEYQLRNEAADGTFNLTLEECGAGVDQ